MTNGTRTETIDAATGAAQVPVAQAVHGVSFAEATRTWLKIGLLGFGGPAGQIALMHRILVEEKRWIGEARFLHALNYCMLLPGPEAQQLATYIGWLLHRTWGGVVAGTLFVLPGFVVIVTLSTIYALFQGTPAIETLFFGLKAAVLAVVVEAVLRIGKRALKNRAMVALAALAFVAIFFLGVPFPLIVLGAAIIGLVGGRLRPDLFSAAAPRAGGGGAADSVLDEQLEHTRPSLGRAVRVVLLWGGLWAALPLLLVAIFGSQSVYGPMAVFFSKMAVVTFGGAYAVLAYVAQEAVGALGWLQPGEMLDGLAMAETTPGPLIMVLTFVGFLAAFRDAGGLDPLLAGILGATLDHLGDVRAVLPVDLPGRPLHRDRARQQGAGRRVVGHHRRRGRRDLEPRRLVRAARHVRRGARGGSGAAAAQPAGPDQPRPLGGPARCGRHGGDVPLPCRHADDARRLRRRGRRDQGRLLGRNHGPGRDVASPWAVHEPGDNNNARHSALGIGIPIPVIILLYLFNVL